MKRQLKRTMSDKSLDRKTISFREFWEDELNTHAYFEKEREAYKAAYARASESGIKHACETFDREQQLKEKNVLIENLQVQVKKLQQKINNQSYEIKSLLKIQEEYNHDREQISELLTAQHAELQKLELELQAKQEELAFVQHVSYGQQKALEKRNKIIEDQENKIKARDLTLESKDKQLVETKQALENTTQFAFTVLNKNLSLQSASYILQAALPIITTAVLATDLGPAIVLLYKHLIQTFPVQDSYSLWVDLPNFSEFKDVFISQQSITPQAYCSVQTPDNLDMPKLEQYSISTQTGSAGITYKPENLSLPKTYTGLCMDKPAYYKTK